MGVVPGAGATAMLGSLIGTVTPGGEKLGAGCAAATDIGTLGTDAALTGTGFAAVGTTALATGAGGKVTGGALEGITDGASGGKAEGVATATGGVAIVGVGAGNIGAGNIGAGFIDDGAITAGEGFCKGATEGGDTIEPAAAIFAGGTVDCAIGVLCATGAVVILEETLSGKGKSRAP
jgi:hypothetical protein